MASEWRANGERMAGRPTFSGYGNCYTFRHESSAKPCRKTQEAQSDLGWLWSFVEVRPAKSGRVFFCETCVENREKSEICHVQQPPNVNAMR